MKKTVQFLALALCLGSSTAYADSSDQMMVMLESLKQQMGKMQATIDQQNIRIRELESRTVPEASQPSTPASPSSGATISDVDAVIPWLEGAKYGGDLRLRYEAFKYYDKSNDFGSTGTSADRTRNRFRFRLRWGFEKDYGDDWKVGFRMATGSTTEPTATNQTLGNNGYFTYKTFNIDRAYATYEPSGLKDRGLLKGAKIGAGKFDNPFYRYSTGIVWDGDVTPEGLYEQANFSLVNTEENKLNVQTTAGQFIVNENAALESDAALYGYQGVVSYSTLRFGAEQPVDLNMGVSYYDYTNWFQTVKSNTTGVSYLRTNSIVADDFRVLDLYPEINFTVAKTPVTLWYDYAKNLANVGTEDIAQSGGDPIHDTDDAWGVGVKIGKAKKKGSWEAFYGY